MKEEKELKSPLVLLKRSALAVLNTVQKSNHTKNANTMCDRLNVMVKKRKQNKTQQSIANTRKELTKIYNKNLLRMSKEH